MSGLAKATLTEVDGNPPAPVSGTEVPVQFNPSSLKLALKNEVEGDKSRGRPPRQFTGKSASELSFDLIFDTADEVGTDGRARSVRELTAQVERFLLPRPKTKKPPPKVQFQWGNLEFVGIIGTLNIDFGLFSPDGIPLRAKMSVSIKEQDPRYTYLAQDPAAQQAAAAPAARPASGATPRDAPEVVSSGQPGTAGGGPTDRSAPALEGESAAEFAARVGIPPEGWRSVTDGVPDPLSLSGGREIGFSSEFPSGGGTGLGGRRGAGGLAGSLSDDLGTALDVALAGTREAGMALAAAGGVAAAIATDVKNRTTAAAQAAVESFASSRPTPAAQLPASGPPARAGGVASAATGGMVGSAGAAGGGRSPGTAATGAPPELMSASERAAALEVDRRAATWGFGVPLRSRILPAAAARTAMTRGAPVLRPHTGPDEPLQPTDPTSPPWVRLPPPGPDRVAADSEQSKRRVALGCGCPPQRGGRTARGGGSCHCT